MNRRDFLKTTAAATGLFSLLGSHRILADTAPTGSINILWIVVDDMGFGDLSSTGTSTYSTPNIDRIGREGVTMENSYVYPVCTATRAAMLTACSPQKYGLQAVLLPGSTAGIPAGAISAAKEFKAHGYHTALIGKWHIGDDADAHPNAQGFDDFFGFLWGETDYYTHTKDVSGVDTLDFYQNGTLVDTKGYTTDLFTSKAISLLEKNQSAPFFLCLSYNAPHYYLAGPTEYGGDTYKSVMRVLDDGIGKVLDALDRLDLTKNTLVVFTTDNGSPYNNPTPPTNAPFSGIKNMLKEGGIRTPLMARLPGIIPRGSRCKENFAIWDLLPTSLNFANLTTSTSFEGKNRKSLFTTQGTTNDDPLCFKYNAQASGGDTRAVVKRNWKLFYYETDGLTKLFDLSSDPAESTDLAGANPDKVAELKADWNAWAASFSPSQGTWP